MGIKTPKQWIVMPKGVSRATRSLFENVIAPFVPDGRHKRRFFVV